MKGIVLVFLFIFIVTGVSFCQNNDVPKRVTKIVGENFRPTIEVLCDSCYSLMSFLRIDVASSRIQSIELSDYTEPWVKKEIDRIKSKIYQDDELNSLITQNKSYNGTYIFPLLIQSDRFPCKSAQNDQRFKKLEDLFKFEGKEFSGESFFCEKLLFIYMKMKCDATNSR